MKSVRTALSWWTLGLLFVVLVVLAGSGEVMGQDGAQEGDEEAWAEEPETAASMLEAFVSSLLSPWPVEVEEELEHVWLVAPRGKAEQCRPAGELLAGEEEEVVRLALWLSDVGRIETEAFTSHQWEEEEQERQQQWEEGGEGMAEQQQQQEEKWGTTEGGGSLWGGLGLPQETPPFAEWFEAPAFQTLSALFKAQQALKRLSCSNVTEAVERAGSGDVVLLSPGIYQAQNISVNGKDLFLIGYTVEETREALLPHLAEQSHALRAGAAQEREREGKPRRAPHTFPTIDCGGGQGFVLQNTELEMWSLRFRNCFNRDRKGNLLQAGLQCVLQPCSNRTREVTERRRAAGLETNSYSATIEDLEKGRPTSSLPDRDAIPPAVETFGELVLSHCTHCYWIPEQSFQRALGDGSDDPPADAPGPAAPSQPDPHSADHIDPLHDDGHEEDDPFFRDEFFAEW